MGNEFMNDFKKTMTYNLISPMLGVQNNRINLSNNVMGYNKLTIDFEHVQQRVFERMVLKDQIDFYDIKRRKIKGEYNREEKKDYHSINQEKMYNKIQEDLYRIPKEVNKIVNECLYMINEYAIKGNKLDKNNKFYDFIEHYKRYSEYKKTGHQTNEIYHDGPVSVSVSKQTGYIYLIGFNLETKNYTPYWITFGNTYMIPFSTKNNNKYEVIFEQNEHLIDDYLQSSKLLQEVNNIDTLDYDKLFYIIEH